MKTKFIIFVILLLYIIGMQPSFSINKKPIIVGSTNYATHNILSNNGCCTKNRITTCCWQLIINNVSSVTYNSNLT